MDALSIVRRLGNGHFVEDLAEALEHVADQVVESGKPGAVTVTLKLSNQDAGDVMLVISDQITRKLPVKKSRATFLFAVEGGLHAQDIRQTTMEFREVTAEQPEVRAAGGEAPVIREAAE